MSVEVVEREGRPEKAIFRDLAMVQLLGRLALSLGMFLVAGLGGWLAHVVSYQTLFLCALVIPCISVLGCVLVKIDYTAPSPINWTILLGGLCYAIFVTVMGLSNVPYGQEIVFVVSLLIILFLLSRLMDNINRSLIWTLIGTAVVIFVFRAMPSPGAGASWFMMDVLGFNKAFFGTLAQIGAGLAILGMWFLAKPITEKPIAWVLGILTVIYFILSLPLIGLYYGLHHYTQTHFGFGAHTIALLDTAIASPFAQLSMIPMLALIARYAPKGHAATWFALMASFMNLALAAGGMISKWLNQIYVVTREVKNPAGDIMVHANYSQLGHLLIICAVMGLIVPLTAIWFLLRPARGA